MKWLLDDGDVWLLLMMFAAGLMPVIADLARGRVLGAEATLGGVLAAFSLFALLRRVLTHVRAAAVRRRLLR